MQQSSRGYGTFLVDPELVLPPHAPASLMDL